MNVKRALRFSLMLYIMTFIIFSIVQLFFTPMSLAACVTAWVLLIPVILLLSKWFFKMDAPTAKKGFLLGVIAVLVGVSLDMILFGVGSVAEGKSFTEVFATFYTDWKMYVALGEVILFTTWAGIEFDATYTKRA